MLGNRRHFSDSNGGSQGSAATLRPLEEYLPIRKFITAQEEFVTYPEKMASAVRDGEKKILEQKVYFARHGNILHNITAGKGVDLIKSKAVLFEDYFWEEGMQDWLNVRLFAEKIISRKISMLELLSADGNTLATSLVSNFHVTGFLHLNSLSIQKWEDIWGTIVSRLMKPNRGLELLIQAANTGCPLSQIEFAEKVRFHCALGNLDHMERKKLREQAAFWEQAALSQGIRLFVSRSHI